MSLMRLPSTPRILVIALRRLGDVLLTTPLIRSLKRAYPDAAIDALVFAGTEGILTGNPDLKNVLTIPARPNFGETLTLLRRIAKRYDLALSTQTGDRPTTLAVAAGRQSVGLLEGKGLAAAAKRFLLSRSCVSDRDQHRVLDILRLAELLGIPAHAEVVSPAGATRPDTAPAKSYAVVHAAPMFTYKRWTADGWRNLPRLCASAASAPSSPAPHRIAPISTRSGKAVTMAAMSCVSTVSSNGRNSPP